MIRCLILICLISFNQLYGQFNLVQNPSFEQCLNCPTNGGAIIGIDFINNVIIPHWNNPSTTLSGGSTDYYHFNENGIQAFDGNSMIGAATYISLFSPIEWSNAREYLQTELIDSLILNKQYLIEFYTVVGLYPSYSGIFLANNIGLHFSDTILHSTNYNYFPLNAQIKYFNNEIILDTNSWTKVCGIYNAHGGEKYMTVGNFNSDLETNSICLAPFWPADGGCYMLFDKFSVTPLDSITGGLQVNAGNDQSICIGDTVFIGEKISNLPANWYLLDGTIVDTNTAGVYVHPSVTTTYVVTMTINGEYSTDTVTVTVGCAGVDELEKPSFRIGPNPNDGDFTLAGQIIKGETITIKTMDGKVVYSKKMDDNSDQQKIHSNLGSGVYFIIIEDESHHLLSQNKFVVTK
jgi:Secretion system C-terminal sorting domain